MPLPAELNVTVNGIFMPSAPARPNSHAPPPTSQRRPDAEADQRVHGRRAVPEPEPRGPVEGPGAPDRDRGGSRQGQPLPAAELRGGHHATRPRRPRPAAGRQPAAGPGPGLAPSRRRRRRRPGGAEGGGVAGALDHADQLGGVTAARVGDVGALGGVVDAGRDAIQPVQPLLDPGGARGAAHPADDKFGLQGGPSVAHGLAPRSRAAGAGPWLPPEPPMSMPPMVPVPPRPGPLTWA